MNKILSDIKYNESQNKQEKKEKKLNKKEGYLTVKETAQLIGVSPLTLRNWDKSKKLVAYRNPLNNYRIYKTRDIDFFLRKIESKGKVQLG